METRTRKQFFMGLVFAVAVMVPRLALGQAPPPQLPLNLGSTAHFTILSGAAITYPLANGIITGDVGAYPIAGSAVHIPPVNVNGIIYEADATGTQAANVVPNSSVLLLAAKNDLQTAMVDAAGRTPVPSGPFLNPNGGNLAGQNLVPGLYKFDTTALIQGGNVTLTGGATDVWIFQIGTNLAVGTGSQVILAGGARADNIFWQVGTEATLDTTSKLQGTILAGQSITMNTGATLIGRALAFTGQVAYGSGPTGSGSLPSDNVLTVANGTGGGSYAAGTVVPITATVPVGQVFAQWTGSPASLAALADPLATATSATMPIADISVTATFTPAAPSTWALTVVNGTGSGSYVAGTVVPVTTVVPSGQVFSHWAGTRADIAALANLSAAATSATMPAANITITATFTAAPPATFTLTVVNGTGGGAYAAGTIVPVVAVVPAGKLFAAWTGNIATLGNASASATTVTMPNTNITVTATFTPAPPATFTLTVVNGTGGGSYVAGTIVPVVAVVPAGQVFAAWTGNIATLANASVSATIVTMPAANITVTATFTAAPPATFTLTVVNGTGGGSYAAGTIVPVVAVVPAGQVFALWTGNIATLAAPASAATSVTMPAANITVAATFTAAPPATFTLTVVNGTGGGAYAAGTIVPVVAVVPAGQVFALWTGNVATLASASASATTVTMPAFNITVTATFTPAPPATFTLTVVNGTGGGSYAAGTIVPVVAVVPAGKVFAAWTGNIANLAVTGSAATTVTMPASNITVTATFTAAPPATFTLTVINGTGGGSYTAGTIVPVVAVVPAGKIFALWTGNIATLANASVSATTVVMPAANITVAATFTAAPPATFTLTVVNGTGGGSYAAGTVVPVVAVVSSGQVFAAWTGNIATLANAAASATTVVMPGANITVTATFTPAPPATFTLTVVNGTGGGSYVAGTIVPVVAVVPAGQLFALWTGDIAYLDKTSNVAANNVTVPAANITISAVFQGSGDTQPPTVTGQFPVPGAWQVPRDALFAVTIGDAGLGVAYQTVKISLGVNDATGKLVYNLIYDGSAETTAGTYDTSAALQAITGHCYRVAVNPASPGAAYRFLFALSQENELGYQQQVSVQITGSDVVGNAILPGDPTANYSFTTVMRSPGVNVKVNSDSVKLTSHDHAKAAADPSGNVWTIWNQTTGAGGTNVFISELAKDGHNCGPENQVVVNAGSQPNAVIAIDNSAGASAGKLYVAWQDNRNGHYDIFISSSTDGVTWTSPVTVDARPTGDVTDKTQPAIAVDGTGQVYVAWTDGSNIFVARSGATFPNATKVTNASTVAPTNPAIAIDSSNVVYLVWQDMRTGVSRIFGANSATGPWTNVAVVSNAGSQTSPVIATEATGNVLHLLWVGPNNTTGNSDVFYAKTVGGLPAVPLAGASIVEDTTGAAHTAPAIAVYGSGVSATVFACWQDARNVTSAAPHDTDIYFAATTVGNAGINSTGFGANILVNDDGTSAAQTLPAFVALSSDEAHMAWTDKRSNANGDIFEAGLMRAKDWTLAEGGAEAFISALAGGAISVDNPTVDDVQDVVISIPAGALPGGMPVTIRKVIDPTNAPAKAVGAAYEFGPSGLTFSAPVTVTMPYPGNIPAAGVTQVLYYDAVTNTWTSDGITTILGPGPSGAGFNSIQFTTTHFSTFILAGGKPVPHASGGGGGGGCAMSRNGESDLALLLLPCVAVALWIGLQIRRAQRRAGR